MTINEFFKYCFSVICNEHLKNLDTLRHVEPPFSPSIKNQYKSIRKQLQANTELVAQQDSFLVVRNSILFRSVKGRQAKKSHRKFTYFVEKKTEEGFKVYSAIGLYDFKMLNFHV
ncbi:hypothetical protein J3L16_14965 [Alteromonas sp. 5E99-2]|uniref:hypothetical protein n=1 Tax=Alteromonas sp. 5E99-2 TaxID=2817683 RepID=UPI001A983CE9|nr:hypothetical protein [Alteromonas sp. 5E99-2]MBO1256993.1 hypothetical protein [Alteromonas sp. 5E99-2]